jgi:hypothetical protein
MREIFMYGSVGRALGDQCLYPEADGVNIAVLREGCAGSKHSRGTAHAWL